MERLKVDEIDSDVGTPVEDINPADNIPIYNYQSIYNDPVEDTLTIRKYPWGTFLTAILQKNISIFASARIWLIVFITTISSLFFYFGSIDQDNWADIVKSVIIAGIGARTLVPVIRELRRK